MVLASSTASCPQRWAAPIHNLTCAYVFPAGYDDGRSKGLPPPEVATPSYYGRIQGDKVIERLLVMAGLRLASALNGLLSNREMDPVNLSWLTMS
jgi:hypothetical protein